MSRSRAFTFALLLLALTTQPPLQAQEQPGLAEWTGDLHALRWETGAALAAITVVGQRSWDWGNRRSFKVRSEGWFGTRTGSGGMDKLGHAFSSYALTNAVVERLVSEGRSPERAAMSAALTSQLLMMYVEVMDGFSDDHGFAPEDVGMNLLGAGFAYARAVHPALRDRLDFRLAYTPSAASSFRPLSDYAGQKYLLALKLGGFDALRATPLRFVELHLGYRARGFSAAERSAGVQRSQQAFVGIGLDLAEIFLGPRRDPQPARSRAARLFLEHVQVPGTAASTRDR